MVAFDRQAYMAGLLLPTKAEKMKEGYQIGPPWLRPLLTTQFFNSCDVHGENNRNECNLYCLDCMGEALCSSCTLQHRDHHVVQIRRSSYHDVVRVSELQKVLDLAGVQTYIINSARVVFLNARPQPRHAKGVTKTCEICDRSLLDSYRYCSLGCKLTGIRRHNDMNFHLQPRQQQQQQQQSGGEDATISMPEAPNPAVPAAPARSSVTSEDTTGSSGGGGISGGHSKRTRSSSSRRAASPPLRLFNHNHEDESGTEDLAGTGGAVENMYSSFPVRGEEGDLSLKTSILQRSLGTLKLRSSSSAEVSCESEQPGSPMAVSSSGAELSPPTPPPTRTAKRRKGTPHRAPLGM